MIHITIQTRTVETAERLARHLMERHLLMFPTLDTDHEELRWADGHFTRESQLLLQGMTKALLYKDIEAAAYELLGTDVVRIHAVPITHMDPVAQRTMLDQTAKV